MNILLTNDDGIDSPGLREFAAELSKIGDVYVCAPEGERSSNSHHLMIHGTLRYEEREVPFAKKAYALWGAPADCTHVSLNLLYKDRIDLVVSGINRGANISTDIIYSGTVAAAREAYILGVPGMAVSLADFHPQSFETAAKVGTKLAKRFSESDDRHSYILNVNIPNISEEEIKGYMFCDHRAHIRYNDVLTTRDEEGKHYIDIVSGGRKVTCDPEDLRTDLVAVDHAYVSLSALHDDHFVKDPQEYLQKLLK